MRKIKVILFLLIGLIIASPTAIYGANDLSVIVSAVDDEGVITSAHDTYSYGDILTINFDDDIIYWSIDGFLRTELENPTSLRITANMEIRVFKAVSDKYLIIYVDTNLEIKSYEYLTLDSELTPPTNLSKPLSTFSGWATLDLYETMLDPLPNATKNQVYVAVYTLDNPIPPTLTLDEGVYSDKPSYEMNDLVTLSADIEKDGLSFSYYINELGDIISTDINHTFTILKSMTIKAVYGKPIPTVYVTLDGPLYLREDYLSYVAQFNLLDNQGLIEYGFEYFDGLSYVKAKANRYNPTTNEFLMSFIDDDKAEFRSYVVVLEDNQIKKYYNDANIQLDSIVEALIVPSTIEEETPLNLITSSFYQSEITWGSSHEEIISSEGIINLPETEILVTLTADILLNNRIHSLSYHIKVMPKELPKWYIEDFENTNLKASYQDGHFMGPYETKIHYFDARNESPYPINNGGILLRNAQNSFIQFTVSNGLRNLSLDYRKALTSANERQLEVIINGEQAILGDAFGKASGADDTIYHLSLPITQVYEGYVTVKIKNIGTTTTDRHVVIDNLKWESNPKGTVQPRVYQIKPNQIMRTLFVGDTFDPTFQVVDQFGTFINDGETTDVVDTSTPNTYVVRYTYSDLDGEVSLDVTYRVIEVPEEDRGYEGLANVELNSYYRDIGILAGEALKQALHERVRLGMVPTRYEDAKYILSYADRNPADPEHLIGIYDNHKIKNYWIGTGEGAWQREHVWPNSRLGVPRVGESERNIASDIHNLRAINGSTNSSRSNKYFDETTTTKSYYPGDDHKGDVARILLYMMVMYPELNLTDLLENLEMNEETTYKPAGAYMGKKSLLLQWHLDDPVDEFEMERNNFIYNGEVYTPTNKLITPQGNRNPFIDRPYYVEWLLAEALNNTEDVMFNTMVYAPFSQAFIQ